MGTKSQHSSPRTRIPRKMMMKVAKVPCPRRKDLREFPNMTSAFDEGEEGDGKADWVLEVVWILKYKPVWDAGKQKNLKILQTSILYDGPLNERFPREHLPHHLASVAHLPPARQEIPVASDTLFTEGSVSLAIGGQKNWRLKNVYNVSCQRQNLAKNVFVCWGERGPEVNEHEKGHIEKHGTTCLGTALTALFWNQNLI